MKFINLTKTLPILESSCTVSVTQWGGGEGVSGGREKKNVKRRIVLEKMSFNHVFLMFLLISSKKK